MSLVTRLHTFFLLARIGNHTQLLHHLQFVADAPVILNRLWRLSARARYRDPSNPGSLGYLISPWNPGRCSEACEPVEARRYPSWRSWRYSSPLTALRNGPLNLLRGILSSRRAT